MRAAVVFLGWPASSRKPTSALMARCNNFDVAFRGENGRFDDNRVRQECPGFEDWLRARVRREFPEPADAGRPFVEMLEDDF
eukprot:4373886-Alexandrium_andersonii.AAC.1